MKMPNVKFAGSIRSEHAKAEKCFDCFPKARNACKEVVTSEDAATKVKRGNRGSAEKERVS